MSANKQGSVLSGEIHPLRSILRVGFFCCLIGQTFVAGCGASTSVAAGTAGGAGVGVAAGTGGGAGHGAELLCQPGQTRTCVGPGACDGGQACDATGNWSTCDCGPQVTGDNGGTSGAGRSTDAGENGGVPVTVGGAGGSNDGEAGAAGAAPISVDEPCPSGRILTDCSGQCAGAAVECPPSCQIMVSLTGFQPGDVVVRTPSLKGARCMKCPPNTSLVYGVTVLPFGNQSEVLHVSVPEPWVVDQEQSVECFAAKATTHCLRITSEVAFTIRTDDQNAPAINIVAEPGDCP